MSKEANKFGLRIKWLGCACFEIDFGGLTVVNDPWITDNPTNGFNWEAVEKCDIITLTHSHHDHIRDIPVLLKKYRSKLMCGELTAIPMLKYTDICPMDLYPLAPNVELDFDTVKIKTLYGTHTRLGESMSAVKERLLNRDFIRNDPLMQELNFIGSIEYRNYLYTMPDGTKILLWGNELLPEQRNILREIKPDIAILQMSKNTAKDTADICMEMGSRVVIAHHFDYPSDNTKLAVSLKNEMAKRAPEVNCIVPECDKWMEL